MTLPAQPPIYTSWAQVVAPIKPGEGTYASGPSWRVWALQKALQEVGRTSVIDDGVYEPGRGTEKAVRGFQENNGLIVDGWAGVATQNALLRKIGGRLDYAEFPSGVLVGICLKETSGLLAPTNDWDPSLTDVGTDCGSMQWRVKGPPYDMDALRAAFDPLPSFTRAAEDDEKGLIYRINRLNLRQPNLSDETVLRASILAHNAPFLYEQFVKYGKLSTPNAEATWTNDGAGGHYTHQEWYWVYSGDVLTLGNVQL